MSWYVAQVPSGIPKDPGQLVWRIYQETDPRQTPVGATNIHGPYQSQAQASTELNSLTHGQSGITQQIHNATGPLDFWHGLNLGAWILRIGEIVLGVVLIGVGVAKMTGVDNKLADVAKTAGKAAMFL